MSCDLTTKQKVGYLLNRFSELKYQRSEFFWKYIEIFILNWKAENHAVELPYITKKQFKEFMKEFATIERTLRDQIRGKLDIEYDAGRYEKANKFRNRYKKDTGSFKEMSGKEAKSFSKNHL